MKNNFTYLLLSGLLLLYLPALAQYPGALDPTFGENGATLISTPDSIHTGGNLVLQSDGKILVVGDIGDLNFAGNDFLITRLMPDGNIDPTYGNNGRARVNFFNLFDSPFASVIQPDDKLVVAGNSYDNANQNKAVVARLNTNGTLDETFGQNGMLAFDLSNDEDVFLSVAILPDGKILLGGDTYEKNSSTLMDLLLVQLNPDGTTDPDFGNNGVVKKSFSPDFESINALIRLPDGKIITVGYQGYFLPNMQVSRFNANGSVDQSFGNNGVRVINLGPGTDDIAYNVAIQPDQKIVFCGSTNTALTLIRLNPDGAFDQSFGSDGKVLTVLDNGIKASALLIQPNGKIVVGTYNWPTPNALSGYIWLLRFLENGSLDDTFGANGVVQSSFYTDYVSCSSVVLQPDGKILMGATTDASTIVWRFENDLVATHETNLEQFHITVSPNPVDANFLISWELVNTTQVSADLYDLKGCFVQNLISAATFFAGKNQVQCRLTKQLEAGCYFVQFTADGYTAHLPILKH